MSNKIYVSYRYNEILVIANTIQKPKRKIYLDITNKCQQHLTKDECETDQHGLNFFTAKVASCITEGMFSNLSDSELLGSAT